MTDSKSIAEAARKVRGKPFPKGNPGRPRGSRNRSKAALEALLDGEAELIEKKAAAMARQGDRTAPKMCFERILGARREPTVVLDLPPIGTANDGAAALAAVVAAVADGQMTPSEGAEVSQLVSATVSALATADFEQRLEALEKAAADSAARGVL